MCKRVSNRKENTKHRRDTKKSLAKQRGPKGKEGRQRYPSLKVQLKRKIAESSML